MNRTGKNVTRNRQTNCARRSGVAGVLLGLLLFAGVCSLTAVRAGATPGVPHGAPRSRTFTIVHSKPAHSSELRRPGAVASDIAIAPAALHVPLPESDVVAVLHPVGALTTRRVPIVGLDGDIRIVEVDVASISNEKDLYGVVAKTSAGVFATLVNRSEETPKYYQITPTATALADDSQAHEITLIDGDEIGRKLPCGVDALEASALNDSNEKPDAGDDVPAPLSAWREIDLAVVLPSEYSQDQTDEYLAGKVLNTVSATNIFLEQLKLAVKVTAIEVFRSTDADPYAQAARSADALAMLETLRREWLNRSGIDYDVVSVWGRGEFDGIYGYAYPKTSCVAPDWSVVFAAQGGDDRAAEVSLSATLAHELGHIIGMSHDRFNPMDSAGPYVMEASFVANPTGYSTVSQLAFEFHAGIGQQGGSCLSDIDDPSEVTGSTEISLAGGLEQWITLREGETFRSPLVVLPARSQVQYSIVKLPPGATFSQYSGVLTYQPDTDTVRGRAGRRSVEALIDVSARGQKLTKRYVFDVIDTNRAPLIRTRLASDTITVRAGKTVRFSLHGVDPDKGDLVKMYLTSRKVYDSMRGSKSLNLRGSDASFTWQPSRRVRGRFTLSFVARDRSGNGIRRNITVLVKPA